MRLVASKDNPGAFYRKAAGRARRELLALPGRLVTATGIPPRWAGYRWLKEETVSEYLRRRGPPAGCVEVVHEASRIQAPTPVNRPDPSQLANDAGWFGFSFRDVPERSCAPTLLVRLSGCRIVCGRRPEGGMFEPAIVSPDDTSLSFPQTKLRPQHAGLLSSGPTRRLRTAVWFLERAYDNHSHWLTAHLPKLLLLKERGLIEHVLLPRKRTGVIDTSLRMMGLSPNDFTQFDDDQVLEVDDLTVVSSDRFRPELLAAVREAFAPDRTEAPHRRVFVSRAKARSRRLVNESALWPRLADAGFERVTLEDFSFEQQIQLMAETSVLAAPHGAGLTNMIFCPPGAQIVEIMDPDYPNPNFYALASALGHSYWLIEGEGVGDGHPLWKDLAVGEEAILQVASRLGRAA